MAELIRMYMMGVLSGTVLAVAVLVIWSIQMFK
jgi:hypothetical protein